jgi:aminopeptidase N
LTDNLTRDEATERARLLNAVAYRVELDFTRGDDIFRSVSAVSFRCARPGASSFVNLTAPAVHEIVLNGEQVPVTAFDGDRILLTRLREANELRVVADCSYSRSGEGLHRFTDPADGGVYLYSQLGPFDAHRVYACFDQPDLKASYELAATAPAGWQVVSNMAPDVAGEQAAGTALLWHFPPAPVMSTYITAVAAGPYHMAQSEHDGIPLGVYCRASLAQYLDEEEIFEITRQGFDFYHAMFGLRYPFGKYDQLFAPEFIAGAMENAGCVTFREDHIFRSRVTDSAREARAGTILHEMAHMWFGDLVTMRWWNDLWLNESFATWAGTLAQAEGTRWANSWTTFAQLKKARAYRQDQMPSTHPIAADIGDIEAVKINFDGITYGKGASVLKQLVAYVGRDNFVAGVRRYVGRHAWSNATLGDLLAPVAEASGRDLSGWSKQWLESAGVNTLRPEFTVGEDGTYTSFAVRQEAPADHPVLRDHRIAIGLYDGTESGLVRRHEVEADISGELTAIGALAGQHQPDLVLVNDADLTYAKIRLDDRSLDTLMTRIGDFTEPLPAVLCWAAAWDMCRDADMAPRDYLRLVLRGVTSVADISVTQALLQQASCALRRYTDPAWRQYGLELAARSLHGLMDRAEPGSDAQLALTQAFAEVANSPDDLALLIALLDGSAQLHGLTLDTELRWRLLHQLVRRGTASEAEIDAELAADPTDAGQRHAARARAAIPTPEAKRAAWQQIIGGTLPSATFRAVLDGFNDLDRLDLLGPYHRPFFEVVGDIWRDWGSDMARWFVINGFPVADSLSPIEATDKLIAHTAPPTALHRLLLEGRDELARALRCQERDRQAG